MQTQQVNVTIIFVDGESLPLTTSVDVSDQVSGASRMAEMFSSNVLPLEIEGTLYIFPMASIRRIEIDPAPATKSPHIMSGLRRR